MWKLVQNREAIPPVVAISPVGDERGKEATLGSLAPVRRHCVVPPHGRETLTQIVRHLLIERNFKWCDYDRLLACNTS
jgi:hypothetical protein